MAFSNRNKLSIQRKMRAILLVIALTVLLTSSSTALTSLVNAKTTDFVMPTYMYVMAQPQPVALGQDVYITMWVDKVPPTANWGQGDRWQNMILTVTLPDGTTEKLGPYQSDGAGGYSLIYHPKMLGNYTFVASWPGMVLTGGPGYPGTATTINNPTFVGNAYAGSTSKPATLTVGTEKASQIPENPLPTDYWQSPVEAFNHYWNTLNGNWLGIGATGQCDGALGNYQAYTQPPLSSHIVWTKAETFGGQIGGTIGTETGGGAFYTSANTQTETGNQQSNYNTGLNDFKFYPIILSGRLYTTWAPYKTGYGFACIDLRNGETLWNVSTTETLMCGQTMYFKSLSSYGAYSFLWTSSGSNYYLYDAFEGNKILTITGVTSSTQYQGDDGSIIGYFVNNTAGTQKLNDITYTSTGPTLGRWNSSLCIGKTIANYVNGTQSWSPARGAQIPWSNGVEWAAPLPTNYKGQNFTGLSISKIDTRDNVIILRANPPATSQYVGTSAWVIESGFDMGGTYAGSGPAKMLWLNNRTTDNSVSYVYGPAAFGAYTVYTKQSQTWEGFSVFTGEKLWGPTEPYPNNLGYYDQQGGIAAEGALYTWSLGGYIFKYNMTNGNLIWSWSDGSSGLTTPYGVWPLWIKSNQNGVVAGQPPNQIITVGTGHEYGPPLFPGAKIYAVNTTTGEKVWEALNFAITASVAQANGYAVSFNSYDGLLTCIGKGLSATTVKAEPSINSNTQVLITGTVTDQSPGQTCLGIPAAGTPAIADEYMTDWMSYLYYQCPKPANATGVKVSLVAIDPNNNYQMIGETTSDSSGNFAIAYTPPVPGMYNIIATFAGTNSYYSSKAETAMLYAEPVENTPSPPALLASTDYTLTIIGVGIAVIIAIAVLGLVLLSKLRKQ